MVLDRAEEIYPDLSGVRDRMDIECLATKRELGFAQNCFRTDVDGCTPKLGTSLVYRGRVVVAPGVSPARLVAHEVQHWEHWHEGDSETGACKRHTPDCWSKEVEAALKKDIP